VSPPIRPNFFGREIRHALHQPFGRADALGGRPFQNFIFPERFTSRLMSAFLESPIPVGFPHDVKSSRPKGPDRNPESLLAIGQLETSAKPARQSQDMKPKTDVRLEMTCKTCFKGN